MNIIFEVVDKTKRRIYLTYERYEHILKHLEMQNKIEYVKETLISPLFIVDLTKNIYVKHYYKYYKNINLKTKYLRVIVKYLNGKGYIITAYFVNKIQ